MSDMNQVENALCALINAIIDSASIKDFTALKSGQIVEEILRLLNPGYFRELLPRDSLQEKYEFQDASILGWSRIVEAMDKYAQSNESVCDGMSISSSVDVILLSEAN